MKMKYLLQRLLWFLVQVHVSCVVKRTHITLQWFSLNTAWVIQEGMWTFLDSDDPLIFWSIVFAKKSFMVF